MRLILIDEIFAQIETYYDLSVSSQRKLQKRELDNNQNKENEERERINEQSLRMVIIHLSSVKYFYRRLFGRMLYHIFGWRVTRVRQGPLAVWYL